MVCDNCFNSALCSECGGCHRCQNRIKPNNIKARTQKGIGLTVLAQSEYGSRCLKINAILQNLKDQLTSCSQTPTPWPMFARPCPSRPRHGYLESRLIKSKEEAITLLKEVLEDDPNGELMLTPYIKSSYNAIWTPTSLVIGPGNDGATSGKHAITIPIVQQEGLLTAALLKEAKVHEDQWPYIEAVYGELNNFKAVLTQLRAGPPLGSLTKDFIPFQVKVREVIKTNGEDLPTWEAIMIKVAEAPEGVVVWHPGGAVTDHYSVHARSFKIPICFSFEPTVGMVLEPQETPHNLDPKAILAGILAGEKVEINSNNASSATKTLLFGLHMSAVLNGEHSKWIGVATSIMLRLGSCALRGEARHHGGMSGKPTREAVYNKFFNHSLSFHRAGSNRLVNLFRYGSWQGSIGGIKWAQCGAATSTLFNAVRDLAINPTEEQAGALLRALNTAVNQAHNGGWWLNKFCDGNAFTQIQQGNIGSVMDCAPALYETEKTFQSLTPSMITKGIANIASWPETTLKPINAKSVEMIYTPGVMALGFRIKSKMLGNLFKPIYAPVDSLEKVIKATQGSVYLIQGDNGYEVECRIPDQAPITLWKEAPLQAQNSKPRL